MNRPVLALLAAGLATLASAAPAAAQDRGTTELALSAAAVKSLSKSGIRVSAARPATYRKRLLVLPVERGTLSPKVALEHGGGLVLRRGRRRAVLSDLRFDLRAGRARLGGRTATVFFKAAGGTRTVDAASGRARLVAARVTLTRTGATLLRRALGARRIPAVLGRIGTDAALRGSAPPSPEIPSAGGGTSGGGAPETPANAPLGAEPPVKARPAAAVGPSGVRIVWHPRDSWIRYLGAGLLAPSRGTIVTDGASEEAARSDGLVYDFAYASVAAQTARSWRVPSAGREAVALYAGGALQFRFDEHGIDLTAREPEVELDGPDSRVIFRIVRKERDRVEDKRNVLLDLDPELVTPTDDGTTVTYANIPAKIAQGAEDSVFADFYPPGSPWGSVTVSYSR